MLVCIYTVNKVTTDFLITVDKLPLLCVLLEALYPILDIQV